MQASWPTLTPLEARFQALQIQLEDLPAGWRMGGIQAEAVPGAEARFLWFYGPPGKSKTWVNVSQELILHTSVEAATNAYNELLEEYSSNWIIPSGLEFS